MVAPSLSIIIVNFNATALLEKCLKSISSHQHRLLPEIIVVDNHSSDGARKTITSEFPHVILIENNRNLGFAKACNQGTKVATGDYVLFLNPDTVIKDDTLEPCIKFIREHPDTGVLGCKLLNLDGSLQPSCADFPCLHKIILDHILKWKIFSDSLRGRLLTKYWSHDSIREVDWILGAFMLTRADLIKKMGGFDEDFFLYGEDLDLCYRIKKTGRKIVFFPYVGVFHKGNPVWDAKRLDLVYDALLKFYRKNFSVLKYFLLKCFILLA